MWALDPADTFTTNQLVADTVEVTSYLRDRFDQEKIYLVGRSSGFHPWCARRPATPRVDHPFIGVGQMVSQRETDIMYWENTFTWAEKTREHRSRRNTAP